MANQDLILKIETEAKKYFKNALPTHDWSHVLRVKKLAEVIGKAEGADLFILELSVLLHYTGRAKENEENGKICHAEEGSKLAEEILKKYNVDKETIKKVCHCISAHRFRSNNIPQTVEAKVLYDADKLDAIGAIGIGRSYSWSGEHKQKLYSIFRDYDAGTGYEKNHTPVKEFYGKLIKVKDKMLTSKGRKIAEERTRFMIAFFSRLKKEIEGEN